MQKWQLFMDDYGFRGPKELDIATPRYYEKPDEVFDILKTMEGHEDPDLTPQGLFERGAKRRVESVQFLEEYLAKKAAGSSRPSEKTTSCSKTLPRTENLPNITSSWSSTISGAGPLRWGSNGWSRAAGLGRPGI